MVRRHKQFSSANEGRLFIESRTVFDYVRNDVTNPDEVVILLHGFNENGRRIFDRLEPAFPARSIVISPNGPFPQVHRTETGYRIGYAWYLYDPATQEYFIDMSVALDYLENGLRALGLSDLPKRLIGFSQGGYLAPIAGHRLRRTTQVIGIGCEYLTAEWPSPLGFRVDGLHGARDEVVVLQEAQQSFEESQRLGNPGQFKVLARSGHKIDEALVEALKEELTVRYTTP